jgi:hypothetical protein
LLKRYKALYFFKINIEYLYKYEDHSLIKIKNKYSKILNEINIPYKDSYYHSSGNIFIVSNKFTQYLEQYNLIKFFHDLPIDRQDYIKCIGWELALGALIDYLNLENGLILILMIDIIF